MLPVRRKLETAGVLPASNRGFLRLRTCSKDRHVGCVLDAALDHPVTSCAYHQYALRRPAAPSLVHERTGRTVYSETRSKNVSQRTAWRVGRRLARSAILSLPDLRVNVADISGAIPGKRRAEAQCDRRDIHLATVVLDRCHHRLGHILRAACAHALRQLHFRVGEHARVADEAGEDCRDADSRPVQLGAHRSRRSRANRTSWRYRSSCPPSLPCPRVRT